MIPITMNKCIKMWPIFEYTGTCKSLTQMRDEEALDIATFSATIVTLTDNSNRPLKD